MSCGRSQTLLCGEARRRSSDPILLWCRSVATAPIRPLTWEPPYAAGAALEKAKRQKKKKKKKKRQPTEREEIVANDATDKCLIYKIYKQLIQLNSKKQTTQ